MTRSFTAAAMLAILAASPALSAEPEAGVRLGTEAGAIAAALGESGWSIAEFEREHGRIDLTVIKDGRRREVHVDPDTGVVDRVEGRGHGGRAGATGPEEAEILSGLKADGWRVLRWERERRRLEVRAERDGRRWELEIDPRTGGIVKMEMETHG